MPFAVSLAVGVVVTTLAFCVASVGRLVCRPNTGNTQHTRSKELDLTASRTVAQNDPAEAVAANPATAVAANPAA